MEEQELFKKYLINVNAFKLIREGYREDFNRGKNVIGCSSVAFCAAKLLISKLFFPGEFEGNMRMLHGKIHHAVVQNPKVLNPLVYNVCDQLGFDKKKVRITPELTFRIEIKPNSPYTGLLKDQKTYMEGHIDVYTNFFLIEIKTTDVPLDRYGKHIASSHYIQTNTYLGHSKPKTDDENKVSLAYLLSINLRGYRSDIKNIEDVCRKYERFSPILLNKKIFDKTIERVKLLFRMIDRGKYNLAGPEHSWECNRCEEKIKKICKKNKQ